MNQIFMLFAIVTLLTTLAASAGEPAFLVNSSFSADTMEGWKTKGYVHGNAAAELETKLLETMSSEIVTDELAPDNSVLKLTTSPDSEKLKDDKGLPTISSRLFHLVDVAETARTGHLTFDAKAEFATRRSNVTLIFSYIGEFEQKPAAVTRKIKVGETWEEQTERFPIPAGTDKVYVAIALYNAGSLWLDDIRIGTEDE